MATRGMIAFGTSETSFEGRYHHWDSYPSGLGKTLYDLYNGHFQRDLDAMKRVLFDEHPGGWSTINDKDWSLEPGFGHGDGDRPQCYCHGDRDEGPYEPYTPSTFEEEWGYIVTPDRQMLIIRPSQSKPLTQRLVGVVVLDGPEPDWDNIENN
jgi:hypothetical protein